MDGDLLRDFRRGDRAALARIYYLYVADVERAAKLALLRMTSSTAALPDVVHEVFLRAFSTNARLSYDGQREYRPYLLMLARNVIIDWAKRAGREVPTADLLELAAERIEDSASANEPPFPPAAVSLANKYVESLPPALQAVHHRRFVLAEPQRQAATALGISRQNLRTLEKRLVSGLRDVLNQAGVTAEGDESDRVNPDHAQRNDLESARPR